jgi:hypothetical protein
MFRARDKRHAWELVFRDMRIMILYRCSRCGVLWCLGGEHGHTYTIPSPPEEREASVFADEEPACMTDRVLEGERFRRVERERAKARELERLEAKRARLEAMREAGRRGMEGTGAR